MARKPPTKRVSKPRKPSPSAEQNHPLCRPPKGMHDVRALIPNQQVGSRWRNDDGKTPALAFYGLEKPDDGTPMQSATVWVAKCSCADWLRCPGSKALDKACDIYEGASITWVRPVRVAK